MTGLFPAESEVPLGIWVKLAAVEVVEITALAGFDFIIIDLEHAPLDVGTASSLIANATARGLTPVVRVPDADSSTIQRLLDAGARGILVPHVETAADAAAIVEAARFPPLGSRGSGAMSRAGLWGKLGRAEYVRDGNEDIVLIAAVESREAIEGVDEILAVEGIDAVFIGAGDLSLSLGLPMSDPEVQRLIDVVLQSAKSAGKPCGGAMGDLQQAVRGLGRGYGYLTLSNDTSLLLKSATSLVDGVRAELTAS